MPAVPPEQARPVRDTSAAPGRRVVRRRRRAATAAPGPSYPACPRGPDRRRPAPAATSLDAGGGTGIAGPAVPGRRAAAVLGVDPDHPDGRAGPRRAGLETRRWPRSSTADSGRADVRRRHRRAGLALGATRRPGRRTACARTVREPGGLSCAVFWNAVAAAAGTEPPRGRRGGLPAPWQPGSADGSPVLDPARVRPVPTRSCAARPPTACRQAGAFSRPAACGASTGPGPYTREQVRAATRCRPWAATPSSSRTGWRAASRPGRRDRRARRRFHDELRHGRGHRATDTLTRTVIPAQNASTQSGLRGKSWPSIRMSLE